MRHLRLMQACITTSAALLIVGIIGDDLSLILCSMGGVAGSGYWLMQHRRSH
jgi:hypothetical protein